MPQLKSSLRSLIVRLYVKARLLSLSSVRSAQASVAASSAHPYYCSVYRSEEVHYWLPVPGWLARDFRNTPPPKGLDIGCAYGTLAVYCRQHLNAEMYCTDFIDEYLSPSLRALYRLNFAVHNIELQPIPWEGTFDLIIMTEVLEHLNFHPLKTLQKIHTALSPQGRFYLTTPDAAEWSRAGNLYPSVDAIPGPDPEIPIRDQHVYVYTRSELADLVEAAGFKILRFSASPGILHRHHALTLGRGNF